MTLTTDDRLNFIEVISLHGHLCDANALDRTAGGAHAVSKGVTVEASGTTSSFTYTDRLVRTADGWRISHRRISPRREPGRGREPRFEEHA